MQSFSPLPYQRRGVRLIEETGIRTLLADEQGLGKTPQALWAARRNPAACFPALVVCPSSAKYAWERAAAKFTNLRAVVLDGRRPPIPGFLPPAKLMIINYDIVSYWLEYFLEIGIKLLILDECQNISNPAAKRTKTCKELAKKAPHMLALSGTPAMNRPAELYPVLKMLWPKRFKSGFKYAQRYCKPRWRPWGWEYKGATHTDELHDRLVACGMIRRLKKDVLPELPDKLREMVPLELTNRDEYMEADNDFRKWVEDKHPTRARAALRAEAIVKVGYLRRLVGRGKVRAVGRWLDHYLEHSDEKIVVFGFHRGMVDALHRHYADKSVIVHGAILGRQRQAAIDEFQHNPKCRMFIGNGACSTAITLTAATTVATVELFWRPADHVQLEDRLHRIGQKSTVWSKYLMAHETVEEEICELLQDKQSVLNNILDGGEGGDSLSLYDMWLDKILGEAA